MSNFPCEKTACMYHKNGLCLQKDPEKYGDSCPDSEDSAGSFRLKVAFKKGTLSIREE